MRRLTALPPDPFFHRTYVRAWQRVKKLRGLAMDRAEAVAVARSTPLRALNGAGPGRLCARRRCADVLAEP